MFAEMLIEEHIMNPNQSSVCVREIQKSLNQSVKRLLELVRLEEWNSGPGDFGKEKPMPQETLLPCREICRKPPKEPLH